MSTRQAKGMIITVIVGFDSARLHFVSLQGSYTLRLRLNDRFEKLLFVGDLTKRLFKGGKK